VDRAIKVTLDDPLFALDLRDFLRRATCVAECDGPRSIVVDLPTAADSSAARTPVALIVAGWQALHPNVQVSVALGGRGQVDRR
jgi:hypothetical protein